MSKRDQANSVKRLITIKNDWRVIYYVAIALIGAVLMLAVFTFPETNFIRPDEQASIELVAIRNKDEEGRLDDPQFILEKDESEPPRKHSYLRSLRIFVSVSQAYFDIAITNL